MNEIFYEVFDNLPCQGLGSKEATQKVINLPNLGTDRIQIFDIGYDSGVSILTLAKQINGQIIATDSYQPYLDLLSDYSFP